MGSLMVCVEESNGYRCRKCPACLNLRKRTWVGRMLMEAQYSESTWFLTLTYAPENLPIDTDTFTPCLRPKDVRLYFARLRATRGGGLKFRYFLCGEYGDRTLRPHYHAILFFSPENPAPADLEATINKYWRKGHTLLVPAEPGSFEYVSSYMLKKSTDTSNLPVPEFQTMSTNPALGTKFIEDLADKYLDSSQLQKNLEEREDVTNVFRTNGSIYPIDPYMRKKLRRIIGVPETRAERQEGMNLEEVLQRNWRDQPDETDKRRSYLYNAKLRRQIKNGRNGRVL